MKRRNFLRNVGATIIINTALFPHISRLFKLERDGCWLRRESNLWTYEPPPRIATAGCTILSRTLSSVEDKRISVSNSQFARALPAGLTWSTLRVGIRGMMTNTGGTLASTPLWRFGLCSGQTNLYLDATTANYIGAAPTSLSSWLYVNASGGNGSQYAASLVYPVKKVGVTETVGSNMGATTCYFMADPTTENRSIYLVDITRGSPNYTLNAFFRSSFANHDATQANFLEQMGYSVPVYSGHTYGTARTLAFDTVAGELDNVLFAWNRSDATWEISDLAISKLA